MSLFVSLIEIKNRTEDSPQHASNKKRDNGTINKFKLQKELNMESIRNHNNLVDSRLIENELEKFKLEIRKLRTTSSKKSEKYQDSLDEYEDPEETKLLSALRDTEEATFAYRNEFNKIVVEKPNLLQINHFEFSYDEGSACSESTAELSEDSLDKCSNLNFIKISAQPKPTIQIEELDEYQDYYEINEDPTKFNVEDETEKPYDPMCYVCCTEDKCEFQKNEFETQSFYSLPNLSENDVEHLMRITKFQSLISVETPTIKDCRCCPPSADVKIKHLDKSIEEAEAERLLIIRRMELEEKNYQELIVKTDAQSKNISDPSSNYVYDKYISDLINEDQMTSQKEFEREMLRKSFKDWLQKTTISKILKTNAFNNEDRVKKINEFLNKVRFEHNKGHISNETNKKKTGKHEKSKKSSSKTVRKDFENKLKVQQDIIELQKLKIQRQERLITEMKLAKFTEMVKESKNDLKMELINAKRTNTKLRAKARCIEMVANIPPDPIEEERRKLLAQGLMVPKFLQKMQERAAERLARHEEARERRERLEYDKEEAKNVAELAKRMEDEEAKRKRFLEMREKRRQEKFAKQLKELERQRMVENMKIARDHYARNLMKRIGFRAFELAIKMKRLNHKKATIHRRRVCMKKFFNLWQKNTKVVWDIKRAQADKLYSYLTYRMYFKHWRHVHSIHQSKFLVAIDWYEVKMSEKLFYRWIQFAEESKMVEGTKMKNAEAHYSCQMKWKLFDAWHRFPALMKIERETEVRRQKWRMKIWDLLPDYKPQDAP
ncbi:hypothetical protein ACKWTF_008986 [Chironomus riparius]